MIFDIINIMNRSSSVTFPSVLFIISEDFYDLPMVDFFKSKTSVLTITDAGEEARSLIRVKRPDIVVTNLKLENADELNFTLKIREEFPDQPIIIISAKTDVPTLLRAIDIGVSKYLIKPIDYEELSETMIQLAQESEEKKELKKQEKLLYEYKNAFDAATIISKTDKNGIITYANDEFCTISGYTSEELIGHSHNIIRHPDTPAFVFRDLWETLRNKQIWKGRIKNKKKSGGSYIVDATIVPILDSNAEISEFLAIRQDVTRLIELEEKERQEKDQQRERHHKIELSEEVHKAKESFLLIFTHELKTPLNAIINFSDYLRKEIAKTDLPQVAKLTELATLIRENGYDMLNTVTTLLDLAKLTSHHLVFHPNVFDLEAMISSQIERSSSLMHQNGIVVTVEGPSNPVKVTNDEERMRQVFSNLLSNAIKYGGGKILVSYGQSGSDFWFSVQDNGPGLKNTESIFELFEQEQHDNLTRSAKGTGIGLYFVKMICDHLGLQVRVERSSLLGGASFVILGSTLFHPKGTP